MAPLVGWAKRCRDERGSGLGEGGKGRNKYAFSPKQRKNFLLTILIIMYSDLNVLIYCPSANRSCMTEKHFNHCNTQ
jgi:hypothetical protein